MLFPNLPSAFAQDDNYPQDPPTRVGRIGYLQGSVSFQPGGQGDWLNAVSNRPLATGDNLWADRDARAEVQIGSTSIRLGSETSITFLDLDNNVTQVRLSVGTLFFRVRHVGSDDSFEVDTPNLAFNVTQPGEYRLDVNENGDQTTAIVWRGDAQITGGGSSYRLSDGQEGNFSGVDQLSYDVGAIGPEDEFSRWNLARDEREDRARSNRYVSEDMTGYEDLDEYGRWRYEPTYGYVWTPVGVPYGWAPYRYGHWIYVAPWGWTWVEDEPWGFAPFHYGRWAYAGGGWCWVPGPVAVVPVYSPALVAFVGGGGFSIGIGVGGGVGWFPLAPGEVYVPWYRTSPRYVQNVNITNTHVTVVQVTNVYNNVTVNHVNNVTYINQHQGRGITVVNHQTFVNAQPVNNHIIRVNARTIQNAPVNHEVVRNIQPDRQSVMGRTRPVKFAPPRSVMTRPVVATRQPVVVNRVAPVRGVARTSELAPVRTVHVVPRGPVQPLQRGAHGQTPGFRNGPPENAARPVENNRNMENRGAVPPAAGVARPGAPQGPGNRSGASVPRPGTQNFPENRPQAPANTTRPEMHNNPPMRNVPRPPSARPEQGRPTQPMNTPPEQPRSNAPYTPPQRNAPEVQRNTPEPQRNAPEVQRNAPEPPRNVQPEPARPNYQPAPPARSRQESAPPEPRQPAPRNQPAPRGETRSAPPAPSQSRSQESHGEKGGTPPQDRGRGKDNGPARFH